MDRRVGRGLGRRYGGSVVGRAGGKVREKATAFEGTWNIAHPETAPGGTILFVVVSVLGAGPNAGSRRPSRSLTSMAPKPYDFTGSRTTIIFHTPAVTYSRSLYRYFFDFYSLVALGDIPGTIGAPRSRGPKL